MEEEKKISETISDFTKFLTDAKYSYAYMKEEMIKQDKITQDILHSLELEELKYKDRARLATRLADSRKQRRIFKDAVEELEPIMNFLEENKKLLNSLGALLGAVRKEEKYHSTRKYYPRIIEKEPT
ncbi:MAG: hypothetical protein LIO53_02750 [Oscillospiraceae bacterium]|nr:hypothetical protein [Oscillospiraceae bacterium]